MVIVYDYSACSYGYVPTQVKRRRITAVIISAHRDCLANLEKKENSEELIRLYDAVYIQLVLYTRFSYDSHIRLKFHCDVFRDGYGNCRKRANRIFYVIDHFPHFSLVNFKFIKVSCKKIFIFELNLQKLILQKFKADCSNLFR